MNDGRARDTLTTLAEAYQLDRMLMDTVFLPILETDRCRYCQEKWQHYANCRFPGHVRCATTIPFQHRLVQFFDEHPAMTYWSVAQALGVTGSIVKAWWTNVKCPRKGSRTFTLPSATIEAGAEDGDDAMSSEGST